MSTLLQEKPTTSSPKQKQRSRHGTSDKAHGHRKAAKRTQPRERRATATSPQTRQSTEVVTLPIAQPARKRSSLGQVFDSISLVKCFTLFGFTVAAMHVIVFGLDLAVAWPFQRASTLFDITCVGCGLALAYLSSSTFRDQVRESKN